MTQVKINDVLYPAYIAGRAADKDWDGRESKLITLEMTYEQAVETFKDNTAWSIVDEAEEYDNSDYCLSGDITDHRDGTVTVKMGKQTAEDVLKIILGGTE